MMLTDKTPHLDRIRAALALAPTENEREVPEALTHVAAIEKQLRAFTDLDKAGDLAAELVNAHPDDFPEVLDEVSAEWQRRQFMRAAITGGIRSHHLDNRKREAISQAVPITLERLTPVFTEAVTTLTKAAPKLPPGPAALDPLAILEADARNPYKQARDAVHTLRTIAAVHNVYRTDTSTPAGTDIAALAQLPTTEPTLMHPDLELKVNTAEMLEHISAVKDVVKAYGEAPDLTVIDIARGRYPGVSLALAPDRDTLRDRIGQVSKAHKFKRLREYAAPATT